MFINQTLIMENSSISELTPGNKILFLLIFLQGIIMIIFNWIKKTIYLIKKDVTKFICIILTVSFNFFFYNYLYSENEINQVIESSIFFIPLFTFILIDFCVVL